MRRTSYGTWTESKEKSETEIAFEYVIETAKEAGMEVVENETSIDFIFIVELIKRLKERGKGMIFRSPYDREFEREQEIEHEAYQRGVSNILDKIRADLHATAELHDDGDYYLREEWIDEYFDKYKSESEDKG